MPRKEKTQPQQAPVTFVDVHFVARDIEVAGVVLRVEHGRVTVSDPAQIEALDAMFGFQREGQ
ncbi:MAG: hypothetical protein OEW08_06245 [Gammaproteobacteria bacterium]|nr:hypothetical protein [Gammaproteobacteria bacterium]